ncbi:MAG: citryl-CoA lyase [bacterium]|nr:citryl-CoA lyase [bacterium]
MQWKTAVSNVNDGEETIRGKKLSALVGTNSFTESIFLIWQGRLPKPDETKMLDAMFVSALDHGTGTASAMTARIVASAKNSLHTSLAAGILAMGERHGSAIEGAAKFFQDNIDCKDVTALVKTLKDKKVRVPGFGHAVLKVDKRAVELLALAKKLGFAKQACALAISTEKELNKISSKPLPLNIDGAMGAIALDMGFDIRVMKGIFITARVPGLVAHIVEEMTDDQGLRRLDESDITYTGK